MHRRKKPNHLMLFVLMGILIGLTLKSKDKKARNKLYKAVEKRQSKLTRWYCAVAWHRIGYALHRVTDYPDITLKVSSILITLFIGSLIGTYTGASIWQ